MVDWFSCGGSSLVISIDCGLEFGVFCLVVVFVFGCFVVAYCGFNSVDLAILGVVFGVCVLW